MTTALGRREALGGHRWLVGRQGRVSGAVFAQRAASATAIGSLSGNMTDEADAENTTTTRKDALSKGIAALFVCYEFRFQ